MQFIIIEQSEGKDGVGIFDWQMGKLPKRIFWSWQRQDRWTETEPTERILNFLMKLIME